MCSGQQNGEFELARNLQIGKLSSSGSKSLGRSSDRPEVTELCGSGTGLTHKLPALVIGLCVPGRGYECL